MSHRIKVAVLGQGRSGYGIHAAWLRQASEQYQVVAVADSMPERHEAVKELGAKGFDRYQALLQQRDLGIELIVNALPSHEHTSGTIAALEAGYHVLCEKPLASKVEDLDAMAAAATKAGRRLFAFQKARFSPGFRKLQDVLASGKLGDLVHARISFSRFARRWDWQASQRYGGGNLNNTGPHPMDQAVVLFGERPPKVFGRLMCHNEFGDADDFASVCLHDQDAPLIEVVVSSFMAYPPGETYNLSCTRGGLTGGARELKWKYFDPATAPRHEPAQGWSDNRQYTTEKLAWIEECWKDDSTLNEFNQMSKGLYDNVYDTLVNGAEPVVKLDQVRRQIAVFEECHRRNPLPRRY
ncbi:MAG: Gfo/Idh/MocA family oxidoreductase [Phycisphaeraceae bacterium]